MRLVLYPHRLSVGGSQLSAVGLARALAGRGHDVVLFGRDGPLAQVARDAGVEVVVDDAGHDWHVSAASTRALRSLARSADVVHAFEPRPAIEAHYATLGTGCRVVTSVLGIRVPWYLPRRGTLVVPTTDKLVFTRRWWHGQLHEIPTPVDVAHERAPGPTFDVADVGFDRGRPVAVVVSRLAEYKHDGVALAMDAAAAADLQLLVVGDGPAREELERRAEALADRAGRRVAALTGELLDPRPAHRVADVVLGVGQSLLRGMAHARPGVVLGRKGHVRVVEPATIDSLAARGFYGVGDGSDATGRLRDELLRLVGDHDLGRWAGDVVAERYGLDAVVDAHEAVYAGVPARPVLGALADGLVLPVSRVGYELARRRYVREAERLGLVAEERANYVFGSLRNLALPPHERVPPADRPSVEEMPTTAQASPR